MRAPSAVWSILPGGLAQTALADTAVIVCGRYELLKDTPQLLKAGRKRRLMLAQAVCQRRMESQARISAPYFIYIIYITIYKYLLIYCISYCKCCVEACEAWLQEQELESFMAPQERIFTNI